ncbi:MAG: hypothetical protein ACFUZC_04935 [Chthoniobacteraceae bacterium]
MIDYVWLALGILVFLAAMWRVIWLVQCETRARMELEFAERERNLVFRPKEHMDDEALVMALSQFGDEHPVWIAVNQIVREQLEYAIGEACRPELATQPGALAFTAGGIAMVRDLQMELWKAHNGSRLEGRAA